MTRRLLLFVAFLLLALGVLEAFVRANGEYLEVLSDKTSMRIKVFERSPSDLGLLFIGTSRFVDCIDEPLFSRNLEIRSGKTIRALNGATAGIGVKGIIRFAEAVSQRGGLRVVVLEASVPSLGKAAVSSETDTLKEDIAAPGQDESGYGPRIETALQGWLADRLGIVAQRKSLRPASAINLFALYSGSVMDTTVWKRKGVLRELFSSSEPGVDEQQFSRIIPVVTSSGDAGIEVTEGVDLSRDETLRNMEQLAGILAGSDTQVIWVAPPVTAAVAQQSESGETRAAAFRYMAYRYGTPVFDYSQAAIPDDCFRDTSHLNKKGRILFSKLLARDLADHF